MAGIGLAPRRSMATEDIRNLQPWTRHARRALRGRLGLVELTGDMLQRTHDPADRLGCDTRIERRRVELGMAEQDLDHADVDILLQKMRGKAVPQCVRGHALADVGHASRSVACARKL